MADLTDCPAFQLRPASLLCCPSVTECHVAAGTAFCQQRHPPLPLPLCCLQLCPGTWLPPAEWTGTSPGVGCLSVSTVALSACQGPFIFLSYVVLSKEVRKALKFACSRKPTPDPALTTKSTLTSVREPGSENKRCLDGGGRRPIEPVFPCHFLPGHPYLRIPFSKEEGVTGHVWPWEEMLSQAKSGPWVCSVLHSYDMAVTIARP